MRSRSPHTSLSKPLPSDAKRPTTSHSRFWIFTRRPTCRPKSEDAFSPTMTSGRPGRNRRPERRRMPPRTSNADGATPRRVTLMRLPSAARLSCATITISGDARGAPSAARATRESTSTRWAASRGMPDVSSDVAPFWTTIALSVRPVERSAVLNPAAIAESTTKTETTSAMPKIARRLMRQRTARLRTLYESGSATSGRPQRVGDARAVGAQRGEEPGEEPEEEREAQSQHCHRRGETEVREPGDRVPDQRDLGEGLDREPAQENAQPAAEDPEGQPLPEHEAHDEPAREAERLEHGDLGLAVPHRHAHRVRGHEENREAHREADAAQEDREVA